MRCLRELQCRGFTPINGRMDRAEDKRFLVDSGSIPRRVKPKLIKLLFAAFMVDVQHVRDIVKPLVCVVEGELDSTTEKSLHYFLAKVT